MSYLLARVVKTAPVTCFLGQGLSSGDSLTVDKLMIGPNPAPDRVSKVITFFFPSVASVTSLVKSGLKLNFEHCGNHRKEVF